MYVGFHTSFLISGVLGSHIFCSMFCPCNAITSKEANVRQKNFFSQLKKRSPVRLEMSHRCSQRAWCFSTLHKKQQNHSFTDYACKAQAQVQILLYYKLLLTNGIIKHFVHKTEIVIELRDVSYLFKKVYYYVLN